MKKLLGASGGSPDELSTCHVGVWLEFEATSAFVVEAEVELVAISSGRWPPSFCDQATVTAITSNTRAYCVRSLMRLSGGLPFRHTDLNDSSVEELAV